MKITDTKLRPYSIPLKEKWLSHSHSSDTRQGYLLQIGDTLGNIGYGDCAPLPGHGTETSAEALKSLEQQLPSFSGLQTTDALNKLPDMNVGPAVRCAIEMALLDLKTKKEDIPLHKWLNPKSSPMVKANANVGALNQDTRERIDIAIRQGYKILKLKVGLFKPEEELKLLNQICTDLPSDIQLRLDANQAWDTKTAKYILKEIEQMPIESLEEPIAGSNLDTLRQLQDGTNITMALDESTTYLDTKQLLQLKPLRRIIVKPTVLGGVLPALRLGQQAHDLGVETVVTTTVDSAAGVWAATQLAAALDSNGKLHHGIATSGWLQQDLGAGPKFTNGCIAMPQTSGLGFVPYN